MRPVNDAAFIVVFIFTIKFQPISGSDILHPGGEIDVVGDQDRMSLSNADDQPLMMASPGIVFKDLFHRSLPLHLQVAELILEGVEDGRDFALACIQVPVEIPAFVETPSPARWRSSPR